MIDIIINVLMTVAKAICVCFSAVIAIVALCFLIWWLAYLIGWGFHSGWTQAADTTDGDDDETDEEDEGETSEDEGGVKCA